MAIRFDASGDYAEITSFPTFDPCTVMFWVYLSVDTNTYGGFWYWGDTGFNDGIYVGVDSDGTTLRMDNFPGANGGGSALTTGTWYHVAYVRSGSSNIVYLNGVSNISFTSSNVPVSTTFRFGNDSVAGERLDGRIANAKVWSGVALTAAEVLQEMHTARPQRLGGLWAWWPMRPGGATERLADYSGNGRNLTAGGTLTDEDGPPVSWGGSPLLLPYASAGAGTFTGSAAVNLPVLTVAGAGTFTAPVYTGSAAVTLPALTGSGAGTHPFIGTATPSLPALTAAGSGTHTAPTYTATATITLPVITAAGSGTFTVPTYSGTSAATLPALTASGSGTHTAPTYTGSAAVTLPPVTASGTGTFSSEYLGAGAGTLPALTAAGSGTFTAPTYTGSAAVSLPTLTASGAGVFASAVYEGTGALTLPTLTAIGNGAFTAPTYTGTGAVSLPLLSVVGAGTHSGPVFTATAVASLRPLTAAGVGTFAADGFDPITDPSGAWGDGRGGAWSGDGRAATWGGGKRGAWE